MGCESNEKILKKDYVRFYPIKSSSASINFSKIQKDENSMNDLE
jgi:hypothetical protein